jgi:hypothetical protein
VAIEIGSRPAAIFEADHLLAADLDAAFLAVEADLDLVSLAAPFPLPAIFDGVDLPLFPAFAADLLADELPPDAADLRLEPEDFPLADLLLPPDDDPLVLLLPDEALRLLVLDELPLEAFFADALLLPAEAFFAPPELLLPPELFLPAEVPDDAFLLLADEPVVLLLRLAVERPLLLPVLPELVEAFLPPFDEPVLLLPPFELVDDASLLDELPEEVPLLPLREEVPLALFLLPPDDLVDVELVDPPPAAALITEPVAPQTAPVAAPATMSPTTSFALS